MVLWIAAGIIACNVLLLFPTVFWWWTGIVLLPLPLVRHFNPDLEANLFTWYSSLLFILTSVSALVNFGLDSIPSGKATWTRYAWLWFCVVTLFLSLDEVATIHESIGRFLEQRMAEQNGWSQWGKDVGKRWILVYSPGIAAVVASILYVFMRLWRRLPGIALCALTGMVLWIASLGMEFFLVEVCRRSEIPARCEQGEILLEEGCEIFGTTAFLIAFVWYAHHRVTQVVAVRREARTAD